MIQLREEHGYEITIAEEGAHALLKVAIKSRPGDHKLRQSQLALPISFPSIIDCNILFSDKIIIQAFQSTIMKSPDDRAAFFGTPHSIVNMKIPPLICL
jgi:hypothetical protein